MVATLENSAVDILEQTRRVVAERWLGSADPGLISAQARLRAVTAAAPARADKPRAFAKLYLDRADFENDRRALALAADVAEPSSPIRVPRVLRVLEAERCLITEHVGGVALRSPLRRHYLALPERYVGLVEELGAWLARFHAAERAPASDNRFVQHRVEAVMELLDRARPWLGASRARATADAVRDLGRALGSGPVHLARCHGDFTLGNMLVDGERLHVIDFGSSGVGLPEIDVAAFLASLHNALGYLPFSRGAEGRLGSAFLSGYRRHGAAELSWAALSLCQLYVLALNVAEPFDYPPPGPAKRVWEAYLFLRNLYQLRSWSRQPRRV